MTKASLATVKNCISFDDGIMLVLIDILDVPATYIGIIHDFDVWRGLDGVLYATD